MPNSDIDFIALFAKRKLLFDFVDFIEYRLIQYEDNFAE